jgi:AcrR family transcriptional regulator
MPRSSEADRDKRTRILEAAYQACERRGVDGARMEEVATGAGVSKGTLYRFFESKEQLLLATLLGSYEQFLPLFDADAASDGDPRERLEAWREALAKVLGALAPRMNVHYQAWGLVARDPGLREQLHGFLREFHRGRGRTLHQMLRDGQRRGAFRADADVTAFCDGIQALLSGFLYRSTFDPERASPERLLRCFDAMVRDALLRPPAGEAPGDG